MPEGSLAESLRAAAEAAVSQTGFTYDESTGLYYDHSTGFYYNSVRVVFRTLGNFFSCKSLAVKVDAKKELRFYLRLEKNVTEDE